MKNLEKLGMLVTLSLCLYLLSRTPGCGTLQPPPRPEQIVSCGELKVGDTKQTPCGDGSNKIEACTEQGLVVAISCKPKGGCGKVTFAEALPLLQEKCASCHDGYKSYAGAKKSLDEMIRRINLPANSPQHMPKGQGDLLLEEKSILTDWKKDGGLENCDKRAEIKRFNFNEIEAAIAVELNSLNEEDRLNSRFLVLTHKVNQNGPSNLDLYRGGARKAVNSLNAKGKRLTQGKAFGPENSIIRIDLEDYELSRQDWEKITKADPLKVESFTNTGALIKFLTQDNRPWMHFDNFIDTVFRNSSLYYDLLGVPPTFLQLTQKLEVKFQADFINFKAMLIGTNKSPISLQKNRLISRHDSLDGYFWTTYDPLSLNGVRERNLFEFPLLRETGGRAVFKFDAGEVIYSLPNGLQAYALFNAQGVRQDAAPVNIVTDTESPVSPEIRNANSCHRCHVAGIIPATDEIRDHVIRNASQFNLQDVELVKVLYRTNDVNASVIKKDQDTYVKALRELDITGEPISASTDVFLLSWDLNQTASFLFLTPEEFVVLLNQSATARAQVGQLLSGGTITYDQFVTILPVLIQDLRLFQEPLGG
jgi:hypothetical protein